jgi:hypothetical protein
VTGQITNPVQEPHFKPSLFSLGSFLLDPNTSLKHSMDSSKEEEEDNLFFITGDASRPECVGEKDSAIIVVYVFRSFFLGRSFFKKNY